MATRAPNQQSTKGITDAQIDKAAAQGRFMKIDDLNSKLRLTGAKKRWAIQPDLAYNLAYRLVGTYQQIRDFLSRMLQPADLERTMANDLITAQNYNTTMADLYNDEIELAKAARSAENEQAQQGPEYTLDQLNDVMTQLGAKTATSAARTVARAQSPRARGPRNTLEDRLRSLKDGHSIDVSLLKADGTGAKTIPTPAGKSKKVGVPNLRIVSNNYAGFQLATGMLGPQYASYAAQYARDYGMGETAIPVQFPTISPRGRNAAAPAKGAAAPVKATAAPIKATGVPVKRAGAVVQAPIQAPAQATAISPGGARRVNRAPRGAVTAQQPIVQPTTALPQISARAPIVQQPMAQQPMAQQPMAQAPMAQQISPRTSVNQQPMAQAPAQQTIPQRAPPAKTTIPARGGLGVNPANRAPGGGLSALLNRASQQPQGPQ